MQPPIPKPTVAHVQANHQGRDFFVGDMHGYMKTFWQGLERLKFNPDTDRVFSVGDLVDRGPDSLGCLKLLENNWFHCVLGNHEIDLYRNLLTPPQVYSESRQWQSELSIDEKDLCLSHLSKLPLAITITTKHQTLGIIHAGVPETRSWPEWLTQIDNGDNEAITFSTQSRTIKQQTLCIRGVDTIFSGHLCLNRPTQYGNIYCLDTSVFIPRSFRGGYGLTFAYIEGQEVKTMTIEGVQ